MQGTPYLVAANCKKFRQSGWRKCAEMKALEAGGCRSRCDGQRDNARAHESWGLTKRHPAGDVSAAIRASAGTACARAATAPANDGFWEVHRGWRMPAMGRDCPVTSGCFPVAHFQRPVCGGEPGRAAVMCRPFAEVQGTAQQTPILQERANCDSCSDGQHVAACRGLPAVTPSELGAVGIIYRRPKAIYRKVLRNMILKTFLVLAWISLTCVLVACQRLSTNSESSQ